jgi:heat shock protein HslJ
VTGRRTILVLALLALVAACGGDDDEQDATATPARSGSDLAGTAWVLSSYEGRSGGTAEAVADAPATLSFRIAGTLDGTTGCNSFSGTYEANDDELTIEVGPATLRACTDDAASAQEAAVMDALPRVASYALDGDELTLSDRGGAVLLTYGPGLTGLAGTSWQVIGVNNGKGAVESSGLTEALTAEFGDDGSFSGFGGCNDVSGPYETSGRDGIEIGPLTSTRMACTPEVDQLEVQYTTALEAAASYEIVGDTLTLRDGSGAAQVTMTAA